jgi:peptidoglycan/LPS O-acetylase OafA/YrhL
MQTLHVRRPMSLGPSTPTGRRAGWFALGFVVMVALGLLRVLIVGDPESPGGTAWMLITSLGALVCGFLAGILALVAMFRHRERSLVAWLALAPGLLALAFLLSEALFPHG